jgi:hypothetical protein
MQFSLDKDRDSLVQGEIHFIQISAVNDVGESELSD